MHSPRRPRSSVRPTGRGPKSKGIWTQAQGETKERWGKLTDDDIQELDGRREVLIGKLQTRYAISYEDAERQVGDFEARRP